MYLFNLTLAEFGALFGAVSAVVVALYLLDRSRRRQIVATLRFWNTSEIPDERKHRRRIQQPWSLLLQVLSLALLLLAIAQLRLGSRDASSRDHVLILDTSAWMGARAAQGTLMDEERRAALGWLHALPAGDRVMVVRADALATPATVFESNRGVVEEAIRSSQAGSSALNLDQALEFAKQAQKLNGRRAGEIAFAGAGRVREQELAMPHPAVPNLRMLAIREPIENCGLRKVGLRRSASDPDVWEIFVAVKNYSAAQRAVDLALQFGGAPVGSRRLVLKPGAEEESTFRWRTRAAGWLEARLLTPDAFPRDNRALLEVPAAASLQVVVYSDDPSLLKPVLTANPSVHADFENPARYNPSTKAQIVIFDRFAPPAAPKANTIWIEPPARQSPIPVRSEKNNVQLARWNSADLLGAGLHATDVQLGSTEVFTPDAGDIPVAEIDSGPVILARPARPPEHKKLLVMGFSPFRTTMKYQLSTPLLFANILRWMAPDIFRRWELNAGTVGTVSVALDRDTDPSAVRVIDDNRQILPSPLRDLHYSSSPDRPEMHDPVRNASRHG
ncbi:MAG: vWA domain-containing protein, partial [Bryobacteraceae bacterium]